MRDIYHAIAPNLVENRLAGNGNTPIDNRCDVLPKTDADVLSKISVDNPSLGPELGGVPDTAPTRELVEANSPNRRRADRCVIDSAGFPNKLARCHLDSGR
jgi:hypothetical protein